VVGVRARTPILYRANLAMRFLARLCFCQSSSM
jgi:hypothetical protein